MHENKVWRLWIFFVELSRRSSSARDSSGGACIETLSSHNKLLAFSPI